TRFEHEEIGHGFDSDSTDEDANGYLKRALGVCSKHIATPLVGNRAPFAPAVAAEERRTDFCLPAGRRRRGCAACDAAFLWRAICSNGRDIPGEDSDASGAVTKQRRAWP